jgi:hypothetical protein
MDSEAHRPRHRRSHTLPCRYRASPLCNIYRLSREISCDNIQVEMSDVRIWTETLVIVTVIVVVAAITWSSAVRAGGNLKNDGALSRERIQNHVGSPRAKLKYRCRRHVCENDLKRVATGDAPGKSGEYRRSSPCSGNEVHADLRGRDDRQVLDKIEHAYRTAVANPTTRRPPSLNAIGNRDRRCVSERVDRKHISMTPIAHMSVDKEAPRRRSNRTQGQGHQT